MPQLSDFNYHLPQELIAQYPTSQRDAARLMVIDRRDGSIRHDRFANVGKYLPPKSRLVVNDSKVIPARLLGKRATGGKVEVFLLRKLSDGVSFEALIKPLGRLKLDEQIHFNGAGVWARLVDPHKRIVRFNKKNLGRYLERIGHMPLPPYIKRADEPLDRKSYQTVYAKAPGSVAAPTAGLHFTEPLLQSLKKAGHGLAKVTLHVNYATFRLVQEADITKHEMHFEEYSVPLATLKALGLDGRGRPLRFAKQSGRPRPVVAVGTTSCRVLETLAQGGAPSGETNIFIYPGYEFRMTDALITNFHLPFSTLLMLVYAFGGAELMQRAYAEAIREKYRFYSYGDAMIIL